MIHYSYYVSGKLVGVRYEFDASGDTLASHKHTPELCHNVVVLKGSVSVQSGDLRHILLAGEIFDFDGTAMHEIQALEDHTRVIHFLLDPPAELADQVKDDIGVHVQP
jgi:quercetin dioxygenase-like cupin family protein